MNNGTGVIRGMARKTTARRLLNAVELYRSFLVGRYSGAPRMRVFPSSVSIEPTTSCNLRCPECPSGLRSFTRPTGMLGMPLFKSAIDQLASRISYLTFYFQGEPYLNPQFTEMVSYAASKGIYTSTSTNAHFLSPEKAEATVNSGLDRMIVSIDGTTQEIYQQYRIGGSLEKVLEGTRNLIAAKKRNRSRSPEIVFQFLVVRPNEHQMSDVHRIAKEIGVDRVVFKSAQIYNFENGSPLIPINAQYSRYRKSQNGTYEVKNKMLRECWKMWHSCVITWDGKVVPCCFDKDAKHVMGDLTMQSFEDIWFGTLYNEFRKTLFESRESIEMCRNCTEGTKVWV